MDAAVVLGNTIKQLRRERLYSQSVIVERTGIGQKYLSDIENGKRKVSIGIIAKIADAFDMNLSELFIKAGL